MSQKYDFDLDDDSSALGNILVIVAAIAAAVLAAVLILIGVYFLLFKDKDTETADFDTAAAETVTETETWQTGGSADNNIENSTDAVDDSADTAFEDPQSAQNQVNTDQGARTKITTILVGDGAAETKSQTLGIDVSRYQGTIDWAQVASAGIDFAMIRVGYRTMTTGEITEDSNARYNLQEATANGIKAGAYFFSTAVSEAEAIEEANWTIDFIDQYKITYPVAYNCEGYENTNSRQYNLTKEERSSFAKAFLDQIHSGGYTPMFYASKAEMEADNKWLTSDLESSYKIWVSWYPSTPYPETADADYSGSHAMWQYTNNGTIAGISYPVDVNVAYFGYESEAAARDDSAPEQVEADVEAMHNFFEVNETVTAKDATNLRNIPSQGDDSTIMLTLINGQTATRTGVSTSGWSRVIYDGATYYAVSSYLTTALTAKVPEPEITDNGIKTQFTDCSENVTPKIEVNLRALPSVTNPDATVVATVKNGEVFRRIGINTDYGWSKVEYNGQVLYCISSYVYVVE